MDIWTILDRSRESNFSVYIAILDWAGKFKKNTNKLLIFLKVYIGNPCVAYILLRSISALTMKKKKVHHFQSKRETAQKIDQLSRQGRP